MTTLKGWRYVGFLTCIVGGIGLALYPIIVDPILNTDKYKRLQKYTREGVNQEEIQPGNMRVWSDPFAPKK